MPYNPRFDSHHGTNQKNTDFDMFLSEMIYFDFSLDCYWHPHNSEINLCHPHTLIPILFGYMDNNSFPNRP